MRATFSKYSAATASFDHPLASVLALLKPKSRVRCRSSGDRPMVTVNASQLDTPTWTSVSFGKMYASLVQKAVWRSDNKRESIGRLCRSVIDFTRMAYE